MLWAMLAPLLAVVHGVAQASRALTPIFRTHADLGSQLFREDFPVLHQSVWDKKPLVYLDSAATSQKPVAVIEAMVQHLQQNNANVHRGAHLLSVRSTEEYEGARDKVARFVNAGSRREIVFTRGATEAINLVAQSWGRANLKSGDEVVLTVMDHHSNIVPWHMLQADVGIKIKFAQLDENECLDLPHLLSLISQRTKLIALPHVSNTLGCVNPITDVVAAAREVGERELSPSPAWKSLCSRASYLDIDARIH